MSKLVAKKALQLLQVSIADSAGHESHAPVAFNDALTLERAICLNPAQQRCDSLAPYTRQHLKGRALNDAQPFWLH